MIKPEKSKNEQAADIFLEILDTDDSESEDFGRNVNQIYKGNIRNNESLIKLKLTKIFRILLNSHIWL